MPRNAATNRVPQQNYNAALSFAGGSGSVVSITDASDLRLATGFTVVARAYLNTRSGDNFKGIVSKGGTASGGERNYLLALNTTNTVLQCGYETVGGANQFASGNRTVPLNQWFMPGVTWDGANVQCYQNGTVDGSPFAATGTPCMTAADLEIGRNQNTNQEWDGVISDVMIWNRALTAQEMSDLYFSSIIPTSGFVDRWRLDEGAGGTANSQTGTHNGTVTSAVWTGNTPMKARKLINGNMVRNGDFEYAPPFTAATTVASRWIDGTAAGSTTNDLFGWFMAPSWTGADGSVSFDSSVFYSGAYSLKIDKTSATGGTSGGAVGLATLVSPSVAIQRQYFVPVAPSRDYRVTFRLKTSSISALNSAGARGRILMYDGVNTASTSSASSSYVTGTNDWQLVTLNFTTTATTTLVNFWCQLDNETGTAWFDDISLTPVYPEGRVPANGNLVKNFDFEVIPTFTAAGTTSSRWIDGTAAGSTTNATYKWSQIIDATSCNISIDGTVSHSGSGSLKVDCLDATGRGRGCYGSRTGTGSSLLVSELNLYAIRVNPSTSITMTYWIKTLNVQGGGAKIAVHEHDGAGVRNTSNSATAVPGTADWQQITFTVTTAATTQYLVLSAEIPTAGAVQTAWFDDIYLAKTTNPGRVAIT